MLRGVWGRGREVDEWADCLGEPETAGKAVWGAGGGVVGACTESYIVAVTGCRSVRSPLIIGTVNFAAAALRRRFFFCGSDDALTTSSSFSAANVGGS